MIPLFYVLPVATTLTPICLQIQQTLDQPSRPLWVEFRRSLKESKLRQDFGVLVERRFTPNGQNTGWVYLMDKEDRPQRLAIDDPGGVIGFTLADRYDQHNPRVVIQAWRARRNGIAFADQFYVPMKPTGGAAANLHKLPRTAQVAWRWTVDIPAHVELLERAIKAGVSIETEEENREVVSDGESPYTYTVTDTYLHIHLPGEDSQRRAVSSDLDVQRFLIPVIEKWEYEMLKRERARRSSSNFILPR